MLLCAFHRRLRIATAALVAIGASLAATGATLALIHRNLWHAAVFVVVMVVLALAVPAVVRGVRWVLWSAVIGLAGQWVAVVATAVELAHGIDPIKTRQLRELGVDPTLGVCINLVFSAAAGLLFVWLAERFLLLRRARAEPQS